jgi:murein DD-endopeptidase MepM/ murein hydrolase activator NlpD
MGRVILLTVAVLAASGPAPLAVTTAARSIRPGELVVLTITTVAPASSVRVRAFDRDLPPFAVDAHTWRALVGIDLGTAIGTHLVAIEASIGKVTERTSYPLVVKARTFPTRTLKVDEAFVNPPPDALERIERETKQLTAIWQSSATTKLWDGPFVAPVPDPANSAFGTRSILNGQPRSPHGGADFRSPEGRPIKAPNGGRVALAGNHYYTGNTVIIDHGLGLFSLFAHLSAMAVKEGDVVKAGDDVGEVGATGRVTGPHLHWTVRANSARVDPLSLLAVLGTPRQD